MKPCVQCLPMALTLIRFPIAIGLVFDAKDGYASRYFLPLFMLAALSDVLDGFVARKLKITTVRGALLDGYADIALYTASLISAYFLYPAIIMKYLLGWIVLILAQIVSWGFSLIKFGKMTSYHTYSAKAWGIIIVMSFIVLFAFGGGTLLPIAILASLICNGEEIFITAIMPYWKAGILNYKVALSLRDEFRRK